MAILNPVISKFTLTQNAIQEVYVCPAGKTNAILGLTLYKENTTQDATIAIALSNKSNPANLTSVDFFMDNIKLIGEVNSAEFDKIIVGQNERIYIKVISGPDITVRLSGIEDTNPKVLKAGILAASSIINTNRTQIYSNNISNVSYISCSITIFNTNTNNNANVEIWISTSATPSDSDKVIKLTVFPKDNVIFENIFMLPNERIFVKSSQPNIEYFINGMCVGV